MCFPNILIKNKWISEFHRTNPRELKCWSSFCVIYFLRYYLMMQHQPIVKRVNGTHEWAHGSYQLLSAPYHCCLYKHRWQDARQPPQSSWLIPRPKSGLLFHGYSGGMCQRVERGLLNIVRCLKHISIDVHQQWSKTVALVWWFLTVGWQCSCNRPLYVSNT